MTQGSRKVLVLDDALERLIQFTEKYGEEWTVVITTTANQCIEQLKLQTFDLICLDHDLGGESYVASGPGTGYEVAWFIAQQLGPQKAGVVVIHSMNTVGAKNMQNVLKDAHIQTIMAPGYWAQR
jgi:hypothetical protein